MSSFSKTISAKKKIAQTIITPNLAGRPRTFDEANVLDAGLHLFWAKGYAAVSVSDLADATGLHPPSLYAAFGSKEKFFLRTVDWYAERYAASTSNLLPAESNAIHWIEILLDQTIRNLTSKNRPKGCYVVIGDLNCAAIAPEASKYLTAKRQRAEDLIYDRLARGVIDGQIIAHSDLKTVAAFIATTIQGFSIQAKDGTSASRMREVAKLCIAAIPRQL
jgi:AcrR family transcriptional regulator